jgi:hypothetical protein
MAGAMQQIATGLVLTSDLQGVCNGPPVLTGQKQGLSYSQQYAAGWGKFYFM